MPASALPVKVSTAERPNKNGPKQVRPTKWGQDSFGRSVQQQQHMLDSEARHGAAAAAAGCAGACRRRRCLQPRACLSVEGAVFHTVRILHGEDVRRHRQTRVERIMNELDRFLEDGQLGGIQVLSPASLVLFKEVVL